MRIGGQQIPAPPENVTFPDRDELKVEETLRETLEVFDPVGRLRDTDRGLLIDSASTIIVPDEFEGEVSDVSELLEIVSTSEFTHECFSQAAFKYVTGVGRELDGYECITSELAEPFIEDGDLPEPFVRLTYNRTLSVGLR